MSVGVVVASGTKKIEWLGCVVLRCVVLCCVVNGAGAMPCTVSSNDCETLKSVETQFGLI